MERLEEEAVKRPAPAAAAAKVPVSFTLNGRVVSAVVSAGWTVLEMLRKHFRLTGAKEGCGEGECGACTVLVDGRPVNSCLMMAAQLGGKDVVSIEGLAACAGADLHPVQKGFIDRGGVQCGFCIPGMVMSAAALLKKNPKASLDDIKAGLSGNLCRCTGYEKIFRAVEQAREELAPKAPSRPARR